MGYGGKWQSRTETRQERMRRWLVAWSIAALLQVPLLLAIYYVIEHSVSDVEFKAVGMDPVAILEPEESHPEGAEVPLEVREDEEKTPEELEEIVPDGTEDPVGQIVSVVPVDVQMMPDKARYASRFAVKVKEETRARKPSEDQIPPQRHDRRKRDEQRPALKQGQRDNEDLARSDRAGTRTSEQGTMPTLDGGPQGAGEPNNPLDGEAILAPHLAGLDPVAKYAPSTAPYASDDFIPDVDKEGETNLLNTVPYRYAGFFERVKRRVRGHWDPNRIYRLRDPTGELYGHKDRYTVLSVVLDSRGYILDTTVAGKSGLKFLDDEAVRAFGAAGPFINPPAGLVKDDGKIRFEFGFAFLIASSRQQFFWRWQ